MRKIVLLLLVFVSTNHLVFGQDKTFRALINETITLPDGTVLAHDLYLPKEKEKVPSILIRTPYGKNGVALFASHFAKNGFAVLVQDVRGKNSSKGVFIPFINEKNDGEDTLDWMCKQSWSNGNIGSWGSSYLSYCVLSLADSKHPALKSVFNLSGWIDGTKVNNPGGALHQMLIIPWLLSDGQISIVSESGADLDEMFAHTPLKEAIPGDGQIFTLSDGSTIPAFEFTADFSYKNVIIPVFHMNGWYDFTIQSTVDAYQKIKSKSKADQYMVLGPWYHNQIYDDYDAIGNYVLPEAGKMNLDSLLSIATSWFNHTLKNHPINIDFKEPVKYYVLFLDTWKFAKQWPPKNNVTPYYLISDHHLSKTKNKSSQSKSLFIFNPESPVPTTGGANFYLFADKVGIMNQEPIEARDDVLVFTSSKFEKEKIVTGAITVDLFIETEGKGTDFTAKLALVNHKGISQNILDGIIRIQSNQLKKGVTKVTIELGDTAFKIGIGEQLRLQISSSNYPKFNRNPNTGIDPLDAVKFIPVKQTIHHSKLYASKINIPFLKE